MLISLILAVVFLYGCDKAVGQEERDEVGRAVPLPRHPYDTARVIYRLCSIDGFVAWEGNRYAVPYEHVTDILPVRITQQELFVYAADLRCVARHELGPAGLACRWIQPDCIHHRDEGNPCSTSIGFTRHLSPWASTQPSSFAR